ncbi:MAG: peptide-methionine (S)-S-oxide reductase [Anaerolineae bacterium]|nr:peptide-methionine (S)-S-oxide reductase [Anaerolineae bacterium]
MRTRVGYSGGTTIGPTYRNIGDHAETIQIDYDPTVTTFDALLAVFWVSHNPIRPMWRRQYMSAIFYHDEAQHTAALAAKDAEAMRRSQTLHTEIAPIGPFYRAEAYHQKYFLRHTAQFERVYEAIYPDLVAFTDSTAVTRVNGYAGGYGSADQLAEEIALLGLSADKQRLLRKVYGHFHR